MRRLMRAKTKDEQLEADHQTLRIQLEESPTLRARDFVYHVAGFFRCDIQAAMDLCFFMVGQDTQKSLALTEAKAAINADIDRERKLEHQRGPHFHEHSRYRTTRKEKGRPGANPIGDYLNTEPMNTNRGTVYWRASA